MVGELDWFDVSGDGTRLVVKDRDELRIVPSAHKEDHDSAESVTVDLSRARFQADPVALWRHAFAEAGRLMRRDFWNPGMSGVDWDAVLDGYRPLLDRVRGDSDFTDLMWEVVAELGTSHAYVGRAGQDFRGPGPGPAAVGLLGADFSRDPAGRWLVDRVLPGETSDPRARSPLEAPGVVVRAGDELVAVDGRPVDPVLGPAPLLAGTIGKPVELAVRPRGADPEVRRRVVVVPLRDERRLRYQDWVAGRRRVVRELGEGRLGYLHIPNMIGEGWADFHRDLRTEMRFDALVMDVRGNGGGHISELVVEKLARRVIGWDQGRWIRPTSYPQDGRRGPVVTVADEFAGSDGDIVTAAIKLLGLGPVVGTRTWGGVVGIDGVPGHELVDGTHMTVPRYAFSFDEYGWGVENYGVDPDVEVLITPDDWAAGHDPQLETAVRLALEALEKQPPKVPADPATGPSKARPPLPPRNRGLMSSGYLRYPHIRGDLLTFAAGDDIWLAPAGGGRAWRLSADDVPVSYPRFSRDGSQVAWTSWRDGNPEVYAADTEGSTANRLTYWGDPQTRVTGWTAAGEVLALTAADQPAQKYRRGYAVPGDGATPPRLLPFGAVTDLAIEDTGTALLTGSVVGEPAFWKRYRGGRAGAVDRHGRGSAVHPGARRPGRPAGQPDGHRRAVVLPVRSRGYREHLLVRAGRQRPGPAHRPRRDVRQEPGHRRAADRLPRGGGHLDPGLARRGGATHAGGHPGFAGRGPGAPAGLGRGSPGRPGLRQDRSGQRGRGARDGALADAQGRPGAGSARRSGGPGPAAAGARRHRAGGLGHRRRRGRRAGDRQRRVASRPPPPSPEAFSAT